MKLQAEIDDALVDALDVAPKVLSSREFVSGVFVALMGLVSDGASARSHPSSAAPEPRRGLKVAARAA